jgi:hypothetical protein
MTITIKTGETLTNTQGNLRIIGEKVSQTVVIVYIPHLCHFKIVRVFPKYRYRATAFENQQERKQNIYDMRMHLYLKIYTYDPRYQRTLTTHVSPISAQQKSGSTAKWNRRVWNSFISRRVKNFVKGITSRT